MTDFIIQTESYKELEGEIKKHEQKMEKLHNQLASQKETILKAEVSNNQLQARIQTQSTDIVSLKKVKGYNLINQ